MPRSHRPGKSYRKGINLIEAAHRFSTVKEAEEFLLQQRWPDGPTCVACGSKEISRRANRKPAPFRCRTCKKDFSVTVGTLMHSSHISINKWAIAFFLYATNLKGVSSLKLHQYLGISQKSAWHMAHRIREAWNPLPDRFTGPVEADETYIDGNEANKHASKNLHAGRGMAGKNPVARVLDQATYRIVTEVVKSTDATTLQRFARQHTETAAQVYADEASDYVGINQHHRAVRHSDKEFVDGMAPPMGPSRVGRCSTKDR